MKIEEEIKQKKFDNEYQKLLINLMFTNSWLSSKFAAVLKQYKISQQQYNILRILRGQFPGSATINLLTERMIDKMSNASRLVEKLRTKGLVEREISKSDRRKVDVKISEAGLKLLEELDSKLSYYERKFINLNEKEASRLNGLLDKLREVKADEV